PTPAPPPPPRVPPHTAHHVHRPPSPSTARLRSPAPGVAGRLPRHLWSCGLRAQGSRPPLVRPDLRPSPPDGLFPHRFETSRPKPPNPPRAPAHRVHPGAAHFPLLPLWSG